MCAAACNPGHDVGVRLAGAIKNGTVALKAFLPPLQILLLLLNFLLLLVLRQYILLLLLTKFLLPLLLLPLQHRQLQRLLHCAPRQPHGGAGVGLKQPQPPGAIHHDVQAEYFEGVGRGEELLAVPRIVQLLEHFAAKQGIQTRLAFLLPALFILGFKKLNEGRI